MTNPAEMAALAARCEQADPCEQRQWLEQAFYAVNPAPECGTPERTAWVAKSRRFQALIEAEAFLDAALTLVPEGWSFEVRASGIGDKGQATVWNPMRQPVPGYDHRVTGCATPALALTAAALRARAEDRERGA